MAVPVSTAPTFELGTPFKLFDLRAGSRINSNYDVVGNGERFLASVMDAQSPIPTTITLNWPALLDR